MINEFKDNEVRDSGIVYNSVFEQIRKLYDKDPLKAGELAISAIELVLTGDISSDDPMVDICLEPLKVIRNKDEKKWDAQKEVKRQQKISKDKLDLIAQLSLEGYTQAQIGTRIGVSQQVISTRMRTIKKDFPELLQKNTSILQEKLPVQTCTNIVDEVQIVQDDTSKNVVKQEKAKFVF